MEGSRGGSPHKNIGEGGGHCLPPKNLAESPSSMPSSYYNREMKRSESATYTAFADQIAIGMANTTDLDE